MTKTVSAVKQPAPSEQANSAITVYTVNEAVWTLMRAVAEDPEA